MKVIVEIDVDNAAFGDHMEFEVARILDELASTVLAYAGVPDKLPLRDINGTPVGEIRVEVDVETDDGVEDSMECDNCGALFDNLQIATLCKDFYDLGEDFRFCSKECWEAFATEHARKLQEEEDHA